MFINFEVLFPDTTVSVLAMDNVEPANIIRSALLSIGIPSNRTGGTFERFGSCYLVYVLNGENIWEVWPTKVA